MSPTHIGGRAMRVMIGNRSELAPGVVSAMHKFRRDVFVRRLGWSLPSGHASESDQYDRPDTTYVVACDADNNVTACARLLPTTRPYMLPELFPMLLSGQTPPSDPGIHELSRFAIDVRVNRDARVLALSAATLKLLGAVMRFAASHDV